MGMVAISFLLSAGSASAAEVTVGMMDGGSSELQVRARLFEPRVLHSGELKKTLSHIPGSRPGDVSTAQQSFAGPGVTMLSQALLWTMMLMGLVMVLIRIIAGLTFEASRQPEYDKPKVQFLTIPSMAYVHVIITVRC